MLKWNDTDKKLGHASPIVTKIKNWKEESEGWVGTWESNQLKWHKLRMRIKKTKTFPFKGCSNIRMPTVETQIKKVKAAMMNMLFGIRPIVQVVPTPSGNWDTARKIEKYLDHCLMEKIKIKPKIAITIDQSLEKGFYLVKPYWRVETTTRVEKLKLDDLSLEEAQWLYAVERTLEEVQQVVAQRVQADMNPMVAKENQAEIIRIVDEIMAGETEVEFTLKDVLYNSPDVALCSPERVYVPTTSGFDPQSCQYIIHEFLLPLSQLQDNVKSKGWDEIPIKEIEQYKGVDLSDKSLDTQKDTREGIERLQGTGLVRIFECYCLYDINDDGVDEKCVVTIAPDFDKLLRKVTLPFYSGKFPFVKFFYELTDDRWFSHRGIPELIEDIVKEIDIQHMQKIDYGTLANSPMFAFRAGMVNENTVNFVFGQGIPIGGMQNIEDTIKPLQFHNPNVELSYEREQMILETKIQELIGQMDFSLQSMINKRQPRTLGEVQMQSQGMQGVSNLDADLMREQFTELINWIWELECQYGDEERIFAYLGKNGYEKIRLGREETQGKYTLSIRGNDQNTNQMVKQQKASFILADTYQSFQMGLTSPQAVIAARKRAYQTLDVEGYEEFLQPPQPRTPEDEVKIGMEDLTDAEQAQVLAKRGIKPDGQGRMLKKIDERDDTEFEQLSNLLDKAPTGGDSGQQGTA